MHFSYGMVELPEGKMKSREGTVVDADDLMDDMVSTARTVSAELGKLDGLSDEETTAISEMVGLGALKYFLQKSTPAKTSPSTPRRLSTSTAIPAPSYSIPTPAYARCSARLPTRGMTVTDYSDVTPGEREITLIQALADFPSVVAAAGQSYSPALIANYVYDLVKLYNQFYHDCSILKEADPPCARSVSPSASRPPAWSRPA